MEKINLNNVEELKAALTELSIHGKSQGKQDIKQVLNILLTK